MINDKITAVNSTFGLAYVCELPVEPVLQSVQSYKIEQKNEVILVPLPAIFLALSVLFMPKCIPILKVLVERQMKNFIARMAQCQPLERSAALRGQRSWPPRESYSLRFVLEDWPRRILYFRSPSLILLTRSYTLP